MPPWKKRYAGKKAVGGESEVWTDADSVSTHLNVTRVNANYRKRAGVQNRAHRSLRCSGWRPVCTSRCLEEYMPCRVSMLRLLQ